MDATNSSNATISAELHASADAAPILSSVVVGLIALQYITRIGNTIGGAWFQALALSLRGNEERLNYHMSEINYIYKNKRRKLKTTQIRVDPI